MSREACRTNHDRVYNNTSCKDLQVTAASSPPSIPVPTTSIASFIGNYRSFIDYCSCIGSIDSFYQSTSWA